MAMNRLGLGLGLTSPLVGRQRTPAELLLGDAAQGFAYAFSQDSAVNRRIGNPSYLGGVAGFPHTFTRATVASYTDAAGLLQFATSGALRLDHDYITGDALGYRSEIAATNRSLLSANLAGVNWNADMSGTGVLPVRTANFGVSPDGLTTSARLQLDKGAGVGFSRVRQTLTVASAAYTISSYIKTADASTKIVGLRNGAVGETKSVLPSWRRFSVSNPATTGPGVEILLWSTLSTAQIADILAWGGQTEAGGFPTSYIATAGATATRNADTLTIPTSAIDWSATFGIINLSGRTALGSGSQVFWQADDGSENNRLRIVRDASNVMRCIVTTGGVEQCNLNLGAVANDTDFAVSFVWAANDFAASLNGGAAVTDVSGTLPTVTTIRVGCSFTGEQCCGTIANLAYLPVAA